MTLPGLSGSFILILLGNYVLLLVDSVNMLYRTITDMFSGNFEFIRDALRIRYLKIIATFSLGSGFGLVFTSQLLGYVLKHWHQLVTAIIIGFISGSLGIVWPWKEKVFKTENGLILFDSDGNEIIQNYRRFWPDFTLKETWLAMLFIVFGIVLIVVIERYAAVRNAGKVK